MLSILDRYILKKFLGTFVFSLSLILSIFIVFDIKEKIQDFLTKKIPLQEILFDYYFMFIPIYANMFSPLFTFIAIIFFTAKMAHRSEFIAILSSGASFNRILRPYLIGACIIAFSSLILNHFVLPKVQSVKIGFEDKWINAGYNTEETNIHKLIGPNEILYLESYDNKVNLGYRISIEKYDGSRLVHMIKAETMRWDSVGNQWMLSDVFERKLVQAPSSDTAKNKLPVFIEKHSFATSKNIKINFTPYDMWRFENKHEVMNYFALKEYIVAERLKGSTRVEYYEVQEYIRTAFPFATFILTIIGVCIASRKVRGGVGLQIAMGLFLSCIYIMLQYIFGTIATSGAASPFLAVWTPNILFSFVAFYFYRTAQQ